MFPRSFLFAAIISYIMGPSVAAQIPSAPSGVTNSLSQESFPQVNSDLVRVLVFVYRPEPWTARSLAKAKQCQKDTREAARRALPGGQFSKSCKVKDTQCQKNILESWHTFQAKLQRPKSCEETEENLTSNDFQLFQDNELQQIKSVQKIRGAMRVDDNRDWHREVSDRPPGRWSSADGDPYSYFSGLLFAKLYLLDYAPHRGTSGPGCHRLRVELPYPDFRASVPDEYCDGQTLLDSLYGTKLGNMLQSELAMSGSSKIPVFVQTGTLHTSGDRRLLDMVLEFPGKQLKLRQDVNGGKLYASIGVLGGIYTRDGKLVTRFSDLLWPSYWPAIMKYGLSKRTLISWRGGSSGDLGGGGSSGDLWEMENRPRYDTYGKDEWDRDWLPSTYETQLELEPGEYILRTVLSDGFKTGRTEVSFSVDKGNAESLYLGSIFLCRHFRSVEAELATEPAEIAPKYVPLVSKGVQFTPVGNTSFAAGEHLFAYFEVSGKEVAAKSGLPIQICIRILDSKAGTLVKEFPLIDTAAYVQDGRSPIRIAREVPIASLAPGEYRLEVQASDCNGIKTPFKTANFVVTASR